MASPEKKWWTAREVAEANLPGLPSSQQRVSEYARQNNWYRKGNVRKRSGRGGGYEFCWTGFPPEAQSFLHIQVSAGFPLSHGSSEDQELEAPHDVGWKWLAHQTDVRRQEGARRHAALVRIEQLVGEGRSQTAATAIVADDLDVGISTIRKRPSVAVGLVCQMFGQEAVRTFGYSPKARVH